MYPARGKCDPRQKSIKFLEKQKNNVRIDIKKCDNANADQTLEQIFRVAFKMKNEGLNNLAG